MREAPRRKAERPADKQPANVGDCWYLLFIFHLLRQTLPENYIRSIYRGSRMVVFRSSRKGLQCLGAHQALNEACKSRQYHVDGISLHSVVLVNFFGVQPVMCLARRTTSTRLTLAFLAVRKLPTISISRGSPAQSSTRGVFLGTNSFSLSTLYTRYIRTSSLVWFKRSDSF